VNLLTSIRNKTARQTAQKKDRTASSPTRQALVVFRRLAS
jgi:hypothetical protein